MEYPKQYADPILSWLGGYYETNYSINPVWTADFTSLPVNPITRGVKPFTIKDEWYYNIRFAPGMKGVTPILMATPPDNTRHTAAAKEHPGRKEIMAWAFNRANGGRSFGFTGAITMTIGATRTSVVWWSTRSCGPLTWKCLKTAPKWTLTRRN